MSDPDFYLSSSEYDSWSEVRECFIIKHLDGPRSRGYWWVKVQPAVPGSICGTTSDVTDLVLAERYREDNIVKLGDKAILVYVCIVLSHDAVESGVIQEKDIKLVSWAEVVRLPSILPSAKNIKS